MEKRNIVCIKFEVKAVTDEAKLKICQELWSHIKTFKNKNINLVGVEYSWSEVKK